MSTLITTLSAWTGFAVFFLYAGLFEYAFHRWVLHHRWRLIPHPYQVHTFLHHRVFRGDAADQVRQEEDRDPILFEWWQGPLLLAVHVPLVWGAQVVSGFPLFWGGMTALAAYYGLYEYLHWCMHTPAGRWIERTRVFRSLDARHRLHHQCRRMNFNVVLPLGDLLFGTFRPGIRLHTPSG